MKNLFIVRKDHASPFKLVMVNVDKSGSPTKSGRAALNLAADSFTYKSINVNNGINQEIAEKLFNTF